MRKQFLFFLLALLPMAASADDSGSCGENLTWTYKESTHTITISGTGEMYSSAGSSSPWRKYSSDIIKVVIEEGVTCIGNSSFKECRNLTSISLPNSLLYIASAAFWDCTGLTSITIPNSLKNIYYNAFWGCSNLKSVYISNLESWCNMSFSSASYSLPITYHLFLNGEEIKDLIIPQDVTSIADYAFSGCIGLTSVTIPNNVKSIGENAFSRCNSLTSINLPDNITSIGGNAFYGCI